MFLCGQTPDMFTNTEDLQQMMFCWEMRPATEKTQHSLQQSPFSGLDRYRRPILVHILILILIFYCNVDCLMVVSCIVEELTDPIHFIAPSPAVICVSDQ